MDRIIKVRVNGSHLEKDSRYAGVQGECNARHLHITFDQGWDGQAKTVTFWDALGLNPVKRTLTADLLADMLADTRSYLVPIPGEAMTEAGEMTFVIDGWSEGVYREPEDVATLVLAVTLEKVTGKTIAVEVFDEALYETVTGKEIYFGEYHYTIEQVEPVKGGFPILHLDRPPYEAEGTEYGTELPVKTKRETLVAPVRQRSVKAELIVQESPMEPEAGEPTDPTPSQAEQLQGQIDTLLGDMQDRAVRAENAAQSAEASAQAADSSETNALASEQAAGLSAQAAKESEENAGLYRQSAYENAVLAQEAGNTAQEAASRAETAAQGAEADRAAAEAAAQSASSSENFADGYMQDAKLAAEEAAHSAAVAEQYQNSSEECGEAAAEAQASAKAAAQSAKEAAEYAEQAAEIAGGDISGVVDGKISGHNVSETAHSDIRQLVSAASNAAAAAQKTADGKEASGTAASAVSAHNSSTTAHNDIRQAVSAAASAAAAAQAAAEADIDCGGFVE